MRLKQLTNSRAEFGIRQHGAEGAVEHLAAGFGEAAA
jgi:hypothetical protein